MSTDRLDQAALDAAQAAAKAAYADVVARRTAAQGEALRLDRERTATRQQFDITARALDQRYADNQAVIGEELGQLDAIFADQNTPTSPAQELEQPTTPPAHDGHTQQLQPVTDQPAPAPPAQARRNNMHPRIWRGIAWFFALLGLIVGLIVARATAHFMWSNVKSDGWNDFLVVLWYLALAAAGMFSGGTAGAMIEERIEERRQNNPGPQHA